MSYQTWEAGGLGPGASSVADSGARVTALYRAHHAELVRLAALMTGDRASGEDIVQDVFARLCARDQLPDPDGTLAYVRAAVLNGCRSALRRRAVARRFGITRDALAADVTQRSAESEALLAEDRRQVLAAPGQAVPAAPRGAGAAVLAGTAGSRDRRRARDQSRHRQVDRRAGHRCPGAPARRASMNSRGARMNRTEERLTDALTAAARAIPEDTLRPLIAPPPRRRAAWVAPLAAALGIVLVVGLAIALGTRLTGSSSGPSGSLAPVPAYYVTEGLGGGAPVVRSTATGKITATVPVPREANAGVDDFLAAARGGVFFVAAAAPGTSGERLYRFSLTRSGQVTGFAVVPGGVLGNRNWTPDAMAASPDGSRVAVSFAFAYAGPGCGDTGQQPCPGPHPDYIDIIDTGTGTRSVWRGGTVPAFSVASLSWTGDGRQLVYLGQSCGRLQVNSEGCAHGGRTAEVRALNPAAGGGHLDSGPVLLRQSARYPYIAQAQISPDGTTITAVVLTGRTSSAHQVADLTPEDLAVIQVSRSSGQLLRVLYQRKLGRTTDINTGPDFLQLSQDGPGQHWLLNGGLACPSGRCTAGFHGWLRDGGLVPLRPVTGQVIDEAW